MRLKREGRPLTRTAFKLSSKVTNFYGCRLFGRSTGLDFPFNSFRKVDDVIVDQHRHSCAVVAVDDHLPLDRCRRVGVQQLGLAQIVP